MVICIRNRNGPNLTIPIPTGLVCNAITARLLAKAVQVDPLQLQRFFAAIRHDKKKHPHWVLVELQSADGDYVKITM